MAHDSFPTGRAALAGALLAALLAAAAPGVAGAVATPLGEGTVVVQPSGEPLSVALDTGAHLHPGDDVVEVREGLQALEVRWTGAPVGAGAAAGLRGLRVDHGATSLAADTLDQLLHALPPEAQVVRVYLGPDGADAGVLLHGEWTWVGGHEGPLMIWPATWWGLGWGVAHDSVSLPPAVTESSDTALSWGFHTGKIFCRVADAKAPLGLAPQCAGAEAAAYASLPNVLLHTELQTAALGLVPAVFTGTAEGAPAGSAGSAPARSEGAVPGAVPRDGPAAEGAAGPDGAPPGAWLPAALARGTAPARLAAVLGASLSPVELGPALPLVLGALALLAPVWALYRRILPSSALQHPVREQMVAAIRAQPGIHESSLARALGLRHTHVQYHVRVLEEAGVLEVRHFGGLKCLFELGRHSATEKAMAMAQRGRSQDVLAHIGAQPGIAQRALARELGMSESSVKWHLDRLQGSGLVRTERARGVKRAWPSTPGAAPPPAEAPAVRSRPAPLPPAEALAAVEPLATLPGPRPTALPSPL